MKNLIIEAKNNYNESGILSLTTEDVLLLGDCTGTKKYKWSGEKSTVKSVITGGFITSYVFLPIKKGPKRMASIGEIIHAKGTHSFVKNQPPAPANNSY